MRFNNKELANIALYGTGFSKEGVLHIKEKQEGLFKRGEQYTERWCKLRGNLLFYFKTKDHKSEPLGLIVLERCTVELDMKEEMPFSFELVFDGDEKIQNMAANSEEDRDLWIEALHIASYECMQMQLQSLREQINARTGRDPLTNPEPTTVEEESDDHENDEPSLEMCFRCDGLPNNSDGSPPDSYLSVYVMTPPSTKWVQLTKTEIIEKNSNPSFSKTVSFSMIGNSTVKTKLKLVANNVRERMTSTMHQIGTVMFSLMDLVSADRNRIRLPINNSDLLPVGYVIIMAWGDEIVTDATDSKNNVKNSPVPQRPPRRHERTKRRDMLKPLYENIISKTFRFPATDGTEISVHEYLGESKLSFQLPQLFLKLWIDEEIKKIQEIQGLGELTGDWEAIRQDTIHSQQKILDIYTQSLRFLANVTGMTFKPSCKKASKELEFIPLNLHLQRIYVSNEEKKKTGCYDFLTVGAFTAYPHKYKSGGLKRLLSQQEGELAMASSSAEHHRGKSKASRMSELMNNVVGLKKEVLFHCESVCRAALKGEVDPLNDTITDLTDKMRQLNLVCESPLLEEAITSYFAAKPEKPDSNPVMEKQEGDASHEVGEVMSDAETPSPSPSPEKDFKWNGTDIVLSPTVEPWDVTRVNAEAALVCTVSAAEDLVTNRTEPHQTSSWLEVISPCIIKLKSCVEILCRRAMLGLTFTNLKDGGKNVMLKYQIKYRRDVIFSQGITAVTTAFITKLRSNMTNEVFLQQLFQVGVLVEMESLVSCHADEMGMLEDFIVAVDDLCNASYRLVQAGNNEEIMPTVSGNRTGYIIDVPVPHTIFQLLPVEIQRGHQIRLVPVLFNVGINETATYAERFGNTDVQDTLNADSSRILCQYCEKYVELLGEPEMDKGPAFSLLELVKLLNGNVLSGKSKNVEILQLASEICRSLNGIRITSCKSAKDRTSMAVTLEQCRILQQEHDLASFAFNHALACMRSEGVRRQNTVKNTGCRKYAFNSVQLMSFPKLYRPPAGTFGNTET